MKWYKSLNVKIPLTLSILATIAIFLIISLINISFNELALITGQQAAQEKVEFLETRIDEITANMLLLANQFADDIDTLDAIRSGNQQALKTLVVTIIARSNVTDVDIVNSDGESLLEDDEGVSGNENELIRLGLLGSEFARITYEADEAENSPLRLVTVSPVIDEKGQVSGAVLLRIELDDEFLSFINYEGHSDNLVLTYEGEVIAKTDVLDGNYDILTIPTLLDKLSSSNVIDDKITYTANGFPQVLAHTPIEVGGQTNSVMTVAIDMQSTFALRDVILRNLIGSIFVLLGVIVIIFLFIVRTQLIVPLNKIQASAQETMAGNYQQRISLSNTDEIGQLAGTVNAMTQAVQTRESELRDLNLTLEQRVADRTEDLQKARDEALGAQRIANENSRLKSEFLSMMSHELRTPMNAIEGFTSIMLNRMAGTEYNAKSERYLGKIQSNSKRLLGLINDFLDLSRIESGRLELAYLPMSPTEMAQSWKDNLSSLAEKKDLEFEISVDPNLPTTLYGDEESLSKIAINLLGNAIKFTEEGRVTLKLEKHDNSMLMIVEDTGMGIPPHAREYIFDEFRQVDMSSKRQYGGTGLGLSIVQKLAIAMGGSITLQSEVGRGSIFTVTVPIETEALAV